MVVNVNKDLYKEIISEGKNAVVDFWAPWCVYCKRIAPVYDKLGIEFEGSDEKVILGKINIDEEPEIAIENGIEVIPTFVFFKDGKIVDSIVAPDSKVKLEEFIRKNL